MRACAHTLCVVVRLPEFLFVCVCIRVCVMAVFSSLHVEYAPKSASPTLSHVFFIACICERMYVRTCV